MSEPLSDDTPGRIVDTRVDVLYCISTGQEIINLLSAVASGAGKVVAVETQGAQTAGWLAHLRQALAMYDKSIALTVLPVDPAVESDPLAMQKLLSADADRLLHGNPSLRIGFAWGGGQKPLATGMWLSYYALSSRRPPHTCCAYYADVHTGELIFSHETTTAPVRLPLPRVALEVRLAAFGIANHHKKSERRLWPDKYLSDPLAHGRSQLPQWLPDVYTLYMTDQDFRRLCFEHAACLSQMNAQPDMTGDATESAIDWDTTLTRDFFKAQFAAVTDNWFDKLPKKYSRESLRGVFSELKLQLPNQLRNRFMVEAAHQRRAVQSISPPASAAVQKWLACCNPDLDCTRSHAVTEIKLTPDGLNFAQLFELLLAWRVLLWAAKHADKVADIRMNIECARSKRQQGASKGAEVLAEFDVLILATSGKLLALDAKSFAVDRQKMRAQSANGVAVGGAASSFLFCFPMFKSDCGEPMRGTPESEWGRQAWYPAQLARQIAQINSDRKNNTTPELQVIPFDESGDFETTLSHPRLLG